MKKFRISDLNDVYEGHFLKDVLPGRYICMGGMGYKKRGERTHTNDGPNGKDYHVHDDDREAFVILQGKAKMEIDGVFYDLTVGDIVIVEPGEDHHLISDENEPCINLWLHASNVAHENHK